MLKPKKPASKPKKALPPPPPPPPQGNPFTYYVPKSATSLTVATKPTGSAAYKKPLGFIHANFKTTSVAPFGAKTTLAVHPVIDKQDVRRAAIEGGYGPQSMWTSHLAMSPAEAAELQRFLFSRLESVICCVQKDINDAWTILPFLRHVEASDKNLLSFTLGGIGTFLTAQNWLAAGGQQLGLCLHKSIYTKALIQFDSAKNKSPDYLIQSKKKHWHVFESKGGRSDDRGQRILEGLEQLDCQFAVGWRPSRLKPATTSVCVHTRVDANRRLEIMAVDPPENDLIEKDRPRQSLALIEGVCKLLLILKTIDQFRALTGIADTFAESDQDWTFERTKRFGELVVGIPTRYLRHEYGVRARVAIYLAADEAASDYPSKGNRQSFWSLVWEKMESLDLALPPHLQNDNAEREMDYSSIVNDIFRIFFDEGNRSFRERCAARLQMTQYWRPLWVTEVDKVQAVLAAEHTGVFTSGGMYIRHDENPTPARGNDESD
ncbi:hypothetical protein [Massilia rubra]|uniref:Uncharacterized protein n=1 Tax=Massilia rubra TaxID=2607910 RepID=A0ABX0LSG6_9BURK|nr:hypothetical protein [Massilia rubra]NHZ36924.1 hypothetical protein [Massilia rubra]